MITIKTENYNHISQDFYNNTIHSIDLNCISCTCGHSGHLIRHGSYKRKIQLAEEVVTFSIVRVYCKICRHTHALLLSSMVPYSQIPLSFQLQLIDAYECGHSFDNILNKQLFIDENNLKSIIRSYRLHWRERLRSAMLFLADVNSLVSGCFACFSRQFMQIKTTRNKLFIPPT